jgi:hypothetical protein
MKRGISGATTLAKDTDAKPETTATRMQRTGRVSKNKLTTGNASKPRDTRARGGSLPNIASSDGEGEGSIVSGKHGDTRTGRSGGVRGTLINRGTARTGGTLGVRGRS